MKLSISKRMTQIALGAVVATGLLAAAGTASADRGADSLASPTRTPDEYVLTVLRDDSTRGIDNFRTAPSSVGVVGVGAMTGFQTTAPSSGSPYSDIDDYKAGPGCSIQCITSGLAYARGPAAKLVVKTDTMARIWIHVTGNGYDRTMNSGADEVMEFGAYFDDLKAGTTYHATVTAKDEEGYEATRSGDFTTLERNVEINYNVANFVERAYGGDADFRMTVWHDGQWDDDLAAYNLPAEDFHVGLGIHFDQYNDVDRYLDFGIELTEAPDYCNNLGYPDNLYFGPGSCSFLSFASVLDGENDLDARPADATSWTEWTLHRTMERPSGLWPSYDDQLLFEIPVTLVVTYTPVF